MSVGEHGGNETVLLACLLGFFLAEAGVAVAFAVVEVGGQETLEKIKLTRTVLIVATKPSEELMAVEPCS